MESKVIRSDTNIRGIKLPTGTFPKECLFLWNVKNERVKGVQQILVNFEAQNFEENIRKYVDWKDAEKLKAQKANNEFTANDMKYHAICRTKYQKEAEANRKIKATNRISQSNVATVRDEVNLIIVQYAM